MAKKRMFTMKIVDSDAFLDMPLSTQALYFHLNMRADDDGFVNNPKRIQRTVGASDDDLKLLIAKRFIIAFESGVVVIKHWRMHNLLRKDRYEETQYHEEMAMLDLKENGSYTEIIEIPMIPEPVTQMATKWQPNDTQRLPQVRLGKDSIDKDSIDKELYVSIIDYLNKKAGTSYKPGTKKTRESINARVAEGFTIDDFKAVIDKKCAEWMGTEFEQYLRPVTLFGTKFESYLNAKVVKKIQQSGIDESKTDLDMIF